MKTYRVDVERGQKYWLVRVPEVDRSTQARHLREVEAMARDLVAIMTDADPESFALDVHIELPGEVSAHLERSARLRDEAAKAQSEAAAESRAAARELAADGLPVRDIGIALGVSFQRAQQLVKAS